MFTIKTKEGYAKKGWTKEHQIYTKNYKEIKLWNEWIAVEQLRHHTNGTIVSSVELLMQAADKIKELNDRMSDSPQESGYIIREDYHED